MKQKWQTKSKADGVRVRFAELRHAAVRWR